MSSKRNGDAPPGVRIGRLNTVAGVRREICRLYREARTGSVLVADASKLANILYIAGRLLQGQELEERVRKLEQTARPLSLLTGEGMSLRPGCSSSRTANVPSPSRA